MKPRQRHSAGFTLLEVVIALLILSLSLTVLMQIQTGNLQQVGKARDLTIATQLARAKTIDIEHLLSHDGFVAGTMVREGDFADEGHPQITFIARVHEVRMDLDQLAGAFGQKLQAAGGDAQLHGGDLAGMMQMIGPLVGPFIDEMAASVRMVELSVAWPSGRQQRQLDLRWLVGLDDFGTMQASELQKMRNQAESAQKAAGGGAPL